MKYKIIITHAGSGMRSESEWTEGTQEELDEVKDGVKSNLNEMKYLEIGDDVWPGDLLRSSAVISFKIQDEE